jgi:hypothetical protein
MREHNKSVKTGNMHQQSLCHSSVLPVTHHDACDREVGVPQAGGWEGVEAAAQPPQKALECPLLLLVRPQGVGEVAAAHLACGSHAGGIKIHCRAGHESGTAGRQQERPVDAVLQTDGSPVMMPSGSSSPVAHTSS